MLGAQRVRSARRRDRGQPSSTRCGARCSRRVCSITGLHTRCFLPRRDAYGGLSGRGRGGTHANARWTCIRWRRLAAGCRRHDHGPWSRRWRWWSSDGSQDDLCHATRTDDDGSRRRRSFANWRERCGIRSRRRIQCTSPGHGAAAPRAWLARERDRSVHRSTDGVDDGAVDLRSRACRGRRWAVAPLRSTRRWSRTATRKGAQHDLSDAPPAHDNRRCGRRGLTHGRERCAVGSRRCHERAPSRDCATAADPRLARQGYGAVHRSTYRVDYGDVDLAVGRGTACG